MRVLVNAGLVTMLMLGAQARGGALPEEHPVSGLSWLADGLQDVPVAIDDEAAAQTGLAELQVLLGHARLEAARLRLVELQARYPDADWSEVEARLEALGGTWTNPEVQWIADPRMPGEDEALLVVLWSDAAAKGQGTDAQAIRAVHEAYTDAGLRVHAMVPPSEEPAPMALRLYGALNLPIGVGVGSAELFEQWGGGRATVALLVVGDKVVWRGYPTQLTPGTVGSVLQGAHQASHKRRADLVWAQLAEEGLGCEVFSLQPALRAAGRVDEGEAVGAVSSVLAEGCGKRRLLVRFGEETWLSEQVLFEGR